MTYMFENPTYQRIVMPRKIGNDYPRYSLYSYCEGVRCEAHRRNEFTGINLHLQFFSKTNFSRFTCPLHRRKC